MGERRRWHIDGLTLDTYSQAAPDEGTVEVMPVSEHQALRDSLAEEVERLRRGAEVLRKASVDPSYSEDDRRIVRSLFREDKETFDRLQALLSQSGGSE